MKDTHGVAGKGWYGFDLDGTLAVYDGWRGMSHIGDPIPQILHVMKELHRVGEIVKIVTARVAPRECVWNNTMFGGTKLSLSRKFPFFKFTDDIRVCEQFEWVLTNKNHSLTTEPEDYRRKFAHEYIEEWSEKHLGFIPEIVSAKDHLMLYLFDDRVVQVEENTGRVIGVFPEKIRWADPAMCPNCG